MEEPAASVRKSEFQSPTYLRKHAPPEEDAEFTNRSKARFRRRLYDRWICKVAGHTYCFANADGVHVALSEDSVESWVSALV